MTWGVICTGPLSRKAPGVGGGSLPGVVAEGVGSNAGELSEMCMYRKGQRWGGGGLIQADRKWELGGLQGVPHSPEGGGTIMS
eukprot:749092-Hanusia_phi.AAC.9